MISQFSEQTKTEISKEDRNLSPADLIQSATSIVVSQLQQVKGQITQSIILSEHKSPAKAQQSSYANLNGYETAKL